MFIIELMYALFIGLTVAWIFGLFLGAHGPWNSFFWFFIVIFLFSWNGGLWIRPFGPTGWGVAWLPFLIIGVSITLLLSAVTPRSVRRRMPFRSKPVVEANANELTAKEFEKTALDFFFWILVIVLTTAIITHYIWRAHPMN